MDNLPPRHRADVDEHLTGDDLLTFLRWLRRNERMHADAAELRVGALDRAIAALESGEPVPPTFDERAPLPPPSAA